tara:strand:- start:311 stop:469 length:159 start_codon:yes stop_codon:yes gene_type:complete
MMALNTPLPALVLLILLKLIADLKPHLTEHSAKKIKGISSYGWPLVCFFALG